MTYSQRHQDKDIVEFYKGERGGFFVDVGATDGISINNTYLLEKHYEWKGICVEPIPDAYDKLVENRTAICCNRAVYNTTDEEVEFTIANNKDLSGISSCLDVYKERIDREGKETIKVKTITLTDLLDKYDAPSFIHYLSLDTEGSELEILRTTDFGKYEFGRIDVEHNYVEPRRTLIRELLLSKGYVYLRENEHDDCFTSPSRSRKSTRSSVQSYLRLRGR